MPPAVGASVGVERTRQLFGNTPRGLTANLIAAVVVAVGLWGSVRTTWLAGWIGATALIILGRAALSAAYRHSPAADQEAARWEQYFIVGCALTGFA